jgi:transcriptional regulator with XRE-family HTH domain
LPEVVLRARFPGVRTNGDALKALREARNLSLRAFQDLTGLNRGYLSRVERGLVRHVADETVHELAAALKVPSAAITHNTQEKT